MVALVILIVLIALTMLLKQGYERQPDAVKSRWLTTRVLWLLAGLLILASLTGRFHPIGVLTSPLLPLAWQLYTKFRPILTETPNSQQAKSEMTRAQACEILGVAQDATEQEIKAMHKALMAKNHPDKGGSPFLAAQINQAKDTLLR